MSKVKELIRRIEVLEQEKQVCKNIAQDVLSREDSWVIIGEKYKQLHAELERRENILRTPLDTSELEESMERLRKILKNESPNNPEQTTQRSKYKSKKKSEGKNAQL